MDYFILRQYGSKLYLIPLVNIPIHLSNDKHSIHETLLNVTIETRCKQQHK